eukprot:363566-Chlamydomonas_euryale.AAC.2
MGERGCNADAEAGRGDSRPTRRPAHVPWPCSPGSTAVQGGSMGGPDRHGQGSRREGRAARSGKQKVERRAKGSRRSSGALREAEGRAARSGKLKVERRA